LLKSKATGGAARFGDTNFSASGYGRSTVVEVIAKFTVPGVLLSDPKKVIKGLPLLYEIL